MLIVDKQVCFGYIHTRVCMYIYIYIFCLIINKRTQYQCLVCYFNAISTFLGYLKPNPSILEGQKWYYFTHR